MLLEDVVVEGKTGVVFDLVVCIDGITSRFQSRIFQTEDETIFTLEKIAKDRFRISRFLFNDLFGWIEENYCEIVFLEKIDHFPVIVKIDGYTSQVFIDEFTKESKNGSTKDSCIKITELIKDKIMSMI